MQRAPESVKRVHEVTVSSPSPQPRAQSLTSPEWVAPAVWGGSCGVSSELSEEGGTPPKGGMSCVTRLLVDGGFDAPGTGSNGTRGEDPESIGCKDCDLETMGGGGSMNPSVLGEYGTGAANRSASD